MMIKNRQAAILGVLIIAFLYVYIVFYEDMREKENIREYEKQVVEQAKNDIEWDKAKRAIMVQGRLYYDTGKESLQYPHYHEFPDGMITSAVDGSQMPTEDNQSNFGTDFSYYYITDDAVELNMNEKWIIFVCQGEEQ